MPPGGLEFWRKMASTMIDHAFDVIELTETVSKIRVTSVCPSKAPRAGPGLVASLDILRDFVEIWPVSERWFNTLSMQAGLNVSATTLDNHEHDLTHQDPKLDTLLYRPFPAADQGTNPPELFHHLELAPHSQLDAASTLTQLSKAKTSMSFEGDLAVGHDEREYPPGDFAGLLALERGHPGGDHIPNQLHGTLDGSFYDLDRFESDLSSFLLGQDAEGVDFGSMFGDNSGWGQVQL
ncbi:hypothetical protein RQP46_007613 [Phenoliferia psychrophenolica]